MPHPAQVTLIRDLLNLTLDVRPGINGSPHLRQNFLRQRGGIRTLHLMEMALLSSTYLRALSGRTISDRASSISVLIRLRAILRCMLLGCLRLDTSS